MSPRPHPPMVPSVHQRLAFSTGSLAELPLPLLLHALWETRRTVLLTLHAPDGRERRLVLRDGVVQGCESSVPGESLLGALVARGILDAALAQNVEATADRAGVSPERLLLQEGALDEVDLRAHWQSVTAQHVLDCLGPGWVQATYILSEAPPGAEGPPLAMLQLLLYGVANLTPLETIREHLPEGTRLQRRIPLPPASRWLRPTDLEAGVLELLSEPLTPAEVAARSNLSLEDATRRLFTLAMLELVEEVAQAGQQPAPPAVAQVVRFLRQELRRPEREAPLPSAGEQAQRHEAPFPPRVDSPTGATPTAPLPPQPGVDAHAPDITGVFAMPALPPFEDLSPEMLESALGVPSPAAGTGAPLAVPGPGGAASEPERGELVEAWVEELPPSVPQGGLDGGPGGDLSPGEPEWQPSVGTAAQAPEPAAAASVQALVEAVPGPGPAEAALQHAPLEPVFPSELERELSGGVPGDASLELGPPAQASWRGPVEAPTAEAPRDGELPLHAVDDASLDEPLGEFSLAEQSEGGHAQVLPSVAPLPDRGEAPGAPGTGGVFSEPEDWTPVRAVATEPPHPEPEDWTSVKAFTAESPLEPEEWTPFDTLTTRAPRTEPQDGAPAGDGGPSVSATEPEAWSPAEPSVTSQEGAAAAPEAAQRAAGPEAGDAVTEPAAQGLEAWAPEQAMLPEQATTMDRAAPAQAATVEQTSATEWDSGALASATHGSATEAVAAESVAAEPAVAEPAVAEPAVAEPAVAEPVSTTQVNAEQLTEAERAATSGQDDDEAWLDAAFAATLASEQQSGVSAGVPAPAAAPSSAPAAALLAPQEETSIEVSLDLPVTASAPSEPQAWVPVDVSIDEVPRPKPVPRPLKAEVAAPPAPKHVAPLATNATRTSDGRAQAKQQPASRPRPRLALGLGLGVLVVLGAGVAVLGRPLLAQRLAAAPAPAPASQAPAPVVRAPAPVPEPVLRAPQEAFVAAPAGARAQPNRPRGRMLSASGMVLPLPEGDALAEAAALLNAGDATRALARFEAAADGPDAAEAWYGAAVALYALERDGEARVRLQRALQARPEHAPSHLLLGFLEQQAAAMAAARAHYERFLAGSPDSALAEDVRTLLAQLP